MTWSIIPTPYGSMSLNGSTQYITYSVGQNLAVSSSTPFTIEFWLYPLTHVQLANAPDGPLCRRFVRGGHANLAQPAPAATAEAPPALAAAERTAPPNILFVLADQWRTQAFGFAGEIGGGLWRSGDYGYYADRVGPFFLDQKLEARGKVKLVTAGPDSVITF